MENNAFDRFRQLIDVSPILGAYVSLAHRIDVGANTLTLAFPPEKEAAAIAIMAEPLYLGLLATAASKAFGRAMTPVFEYSEPEF